MDAFSGYGWRRLRYCVIGAGGAVMAEESAQEKTEEPTARKLQKAREDGQVARSQELPGAAVMIGAVTTMVLMGGWLITS